MQKSLIGVAPGSLFFKSTPPGGVQGARWGALLGHKQVRVQRDLQVPERSTCSLITWSYLQNSPYEEVSAMGYSLEPNPKNIISPVLPRVDLKQNIPTSFTDPGLSNHA